MTLFEFYLRRAFSSGAPTLKGLNMDTLYLVFKDRFRFPNPYLVAHESFSVAPQTNIFRLKQTATLSDYVQLVKRVSLRRQQLFFELPLPDNFFRRRNNRPLSNSLRREAAVTNASCCRLECQLPCFRRKGIIDGIFCLSTPQRKKFSTTEIRLTRSRRSLNSPAISSSNFSAACPVHQPSNCLYRRDKLCSERQLTARRCPP
jgi:hypothetical protein